MIDDADSAAEAAGGEPAARKVYWTETALGQLESLMREQERHSPLLAQRLAQRLTQRSAALANSSRGSIVNPEFQSEDVREVTEGPYRLVFLRQPERIDVLAVLKAAG